MFSDGPANTALITAAARALENLQENPVVIDPYAEALAGDEGQKLLGHYGEAFVLVETIRTKFFDDAIQDSVKRGIKQFVVMGAGLDSRPYRFNFPEGTLWMEVDFGSILEYKRKVLKDAVPSVVLVDIPKNVTDLDVSSDLVQKGFKPGEPSAWIGEGLIPYLKDEEVEKLLSLVSSASAKGSELIMTCPSKKLIESNSSSSERQQFLSSFGAGYLFSGNDRPEELVGKHGYNAEAVFIGHKKAHYGLLPMEPLETLPENFIAEWFIKGVKQ